MRKISIALGLLVASSILVWVYLATKFEQIARDEILPRIKDNEYIVSTDTDSAIIEKFKFRIILKDVTIFPQSKSLKIFSDQVVACYNPFNDKIVARFISDKFKSGSGKTEIYFIAQDQKVEFNRALLSKKFDDIDVVISSGESTAYYTSDDSIISHLKKSTISLTSKLDKDGFYNTDLKMDAAGIESTPESKYFKHVFEELLPGLAQEQSSLDQRFDKRFEKVEEYYRKILNKLGPLDYSSEFSLKLDKKHAENIVAALKKEIEPIEIYKNFSFTGDNYFLSVKETYGNSSTLDSFSYKLAGDGSFITSDLNIFLTKNYSDAQKKDIAGLLLELANSIMSQTNQTFSSEDFKGLFDKYLDTKKINFSFNANYDIVSNNASHSLELMVNDLKINADGSVKEQKYDGKLTLVTPKTLISGISDLYDGGIKLLVQKNGTDTNNVTLIVENIKNNGMELLSAFDKKDSLKEDDNFESNVSFNLGNFEFKVNDKGILDLLTDERVVKFLKNMPKNAE